MGKAYGKIVLAILAAMPATYLARYLGYGFTGQCVMVSIALSAHYFVNKPE